MRKSTIAAVALGAPLLIATLACGSSSSDSRGPGVDNGDAKKSGESKPAANKNEHTIVFEVTGSGAANNISYGLGGNQSQDNGAKLPWTKESKSTDAFLITSLVAQNGGSGEIGCKITVDGKVVSENKSQGQYAVVTCTGTK